MLSEGDKAICAEIAGEVTRSVLQQHIDSCPHGIKMGKIVMLLIGACFGGAAGGGSIVGVIIHFMGG